MSITTVDCGGNNLLYDSFDDLLRFIDIGKVLLLNNENDVVFIHNKHLKKFYNDDYYFYNDSSVYDEEYLEYHCCEHFHEIIIIFPNIQNKLQIINLNDDVYDFELSKDDVIKFLSQSDNSFYLYDLYKTSPKLNHTCQYLLCKI